MSKKISLDTEVNEDDVEVSGLDHRLALLESADMGRRYREMKQHMDTEDKNIAVLFNELEHMAKEREKDRVEFLNKLSENARQINALQAWKNNCTMWAAVWAGTCAAFMTAATAIKFYWNEIKHLIQGLGQ